MKAVVISTPPAINYGGYMYLFEENGIEWELVDALEPDDIVAACKGATVVICSIARFTSEVIERLDDSVKCIIRGAMGFETIDIEAATKRGIMVCNVPDYGVQEVAVMTMTLMLAAIRNVGEYNNLVRQGWWTKMGKRSGHPPHRVSALTLGLMGFGRIAKLTAKYAQAFGMNVMAYDPFLPDQVFEEAGVTRAEESELLASADVISMHIPLMERRLHR